MYKSDHYGIEIIVVKQLDLLLEMYKSDHYGIEIIFTILFVGNSVNGINQTIMGLKS